MRETVLAEAAEARAPGRKARCVFISHAFERKYESNRVAGRGSRWSNRELEKVLHALMSTSKATLLPNLFTPLLLQRRDARWPNRKTMKLSGTRPKVAELEGEEAGIERAAA